MTYRYRDQNTPNAGHRLAEMAEIYKDRAGTYGECYITVGNVMAVLFPDGVVLKTEDDFRRFHLFEWAIGKIVRYTSNWENGGHKDSLDDAAVYLAILSNEDRLLKL